MYLTIFGQVLYCTWCHINDAFCLCAQLFWCFKLKKHIFTYSSHCALLTVHTCVLSYYTPNCMVSCLKIDTLFKVCMVGCILPSSFPLPPKKKLHQSLIYPLLWISDEWFYLLADAEVNVNIVLTSIIYLLSINEWFYLLVDAEVNVNIMLVIHTIQVYPILTPDMHVW